MSLYEEDENWIIENKEVEKIAVDYFDGMFSTTVPLEFNSFLNEITPKITPHMDQRLIRFATEDEVR